MKHYKQLNQGAIIFKYYIYPSEAHATGQRPVARSEHSERSVGEALLHFIVLKKISRISTTHKKKIPSLISLTSYIRST